MTEDKTIIFQVVQIDNFVKIDYVCTPTEEHAVMREIEITPALDEECITKFIAGMKAHDHEKELKEYFEFCYGIPYDEKHREEAERLLEIRGKKEPSEFMKKMMRDMLEKWQKNV